MDSEHVLIKIPSPHFDASNCAQFRHEASRNLDEGVKKFILDFSETVFIDSAAIGTLLFLYKMVGNKDHLCLFGLQKRVKSTLDLVNFTNLFMIRDNIEEAKKSLK